MIKIEKDKIKNWIRSNRDTFEMFAWFWGANTLLAFFLILIYKSMIMSCVLL